MFPNVREYPATYCSWYFFHFVYIDGRVENFVHAPSAIRLLHDFIRVCIACIQAKEHEQLKHEVISLTQRRAESAKIKSDVMVKINEAKKRKSTFVFNDIL